TLLRTTINVRWTLEAGRITNTPWSPVKKTQNADAMIWKLQRREVLARPQRADADEGGLRRKTSQGRSCCAHEDRADKESRLTFYTPVDETSFDFAPTQSL